MEVESLILTCRYCREPADLNSLIKPCDCKGSLAYVHESCLKQWLGVLSELGTLEEDWAPPLEPKPKPLSCEICKAKFSKSLLKDLAHPCKSSRVGGRRELFCWVLIMVVSLLLSFLLAFIFLAVDESYLTTNRVVAAAIWLTFAVLWLATFGGGCYHLYRNYRTLHAFRATLPFSGPNQLLI